MENQNNTSTLKIIIIVLSLLLLGSLFYIFKLTSDANTLQTTISSTKTEKENVMAQLKELNSTYDAAIAENTTMSDELIAEREKVVGLITQLEKSKGDVASLKKFKEQYTN